MYINNEERKAKIGRINVSVSRDNSIKLRFTFPKGKRNDINISTNTDEGWIKALRIAQTINADIELGQFDSTLARYSSRRSQALELAGRELNLKEIWERYKDLKLTGCFYGCSPVRQPLSLVKTGFDDAAAVVRYRQNTHCCQNFTCCHQLVNFIKEKLTCHVLELIGL